MSPNELTSHQFTMMKKSRWEFLSYKEWKAQVIISISRSCLFLHRQIHQIDSLSSFSFFFSLKTRQFHNTHWFVKCQNIYHFIVKFDRNINSSTSEKFSAVSILKKNVCLTRSKGVIFQTQKSSRTAKKCKIIHRTSSTSMDPQNWSLLVKLFPWKFRLKKHISHWSPLMFTKGRPFV